MKKKILFLPLILMILSFSACEQFDNIVNDIVDDIKELNDIPVNADIHLDYLPINLFKIPTPVELDLRQKIEDQLGTDEVLNQVKDIELDELVIDLVSAENRDNFDFLESVSLGIKTDELEYKEIAKLDKVPSGKTSIELETKDNLYVDEYAKSKSLQVVVTFQSLKDVRDLNIKLKMEFDGKIDPSL